MSIDFSGTVLAMRGKQCVCIATDMRYGEQGHTVAIDVKKIHKVVDRLYVGLCGFNSDTQTVLDQLTLQSELYELRENRKLKPKVLSKMLSNLLYSKRFGGYYIQPLVAGLDPITFESYVSDMDGLGCICEPEDFSVVGSSEHFALGACESFWQKDMGPDELFEATAQAMLSAMDRDANAGQGVVIYTITKDAVEMKTIKARLD